MQIRSLSSLLFTACLLAGPAGASSFDARGADITLPGGPPDHAAFHRPPARTLPPGLQRLLLTAPAEPSRSPRSVLPPPGLAALEPTASVPLPGALPFLLAALGGFALLRRR